MIKFKTALINMLFRFEILSDLPGRLRLKVNNHKKIPPEAIQYQDYGIEAIKKLDGINNIKINNIIGTILIEYDKRKLNSKMIVSWLNAVKKLALDNESLINSLEGKTEDEIKNILFSLLENYMKINSIK
ncbi:HMA2 domain-containing protein [Peptostreptococcus canis]|uniref:Cation transporter n=1 Tax=Peptostreptococcus canis TaxID=1159213 RepID=A0ABR6TLC2_9FIRM|nr:cation transporter [Peptostreptococcus canis]MBC2576208.1 cation transporter [Peptostreptococcus canis]MBP1998257.1 copper chaperone CopZ [Peptostreptococcus canis]